MPPPAGVICPTHHAPCGKSVLCTKCMLDGRVPPPAGVVCTSHCAPCSVTGSVPGRSASGASTSNARQLAANTSKEAIAATNAAKGGDRKGKAKVATPSQKMQMIALKMDIPAELTYVEANKLLGARK